MTSMSDGVSRPSVKPLQIGSNRLRPRTCSTLVFHNFARSTAALRENPYEQLIALDELSRDHARQRVDKASRAALPYGVGYR